MTAHMLNPALCNMTAIDFPAIRASTPLSTVVATYVKLTRAGREWKACCPFHPDRTPSFTVNDDKGFGHCFGCGWHGDAADFIAALEGCGLREAAVRLGAGDLPLARPDCRGNVGADKTDTVAAAVRIWRQAEPIGGTAAEAYLRRRGIHIALPPTLRFARLKHPAGGVHPCLVAVAISAEKTFAGIQRTYLTDPGRKAPVDPVKMSLGRIAGCAIRLAPPAGELIVCEGLEDGLTLQQELGRAVWVAAGASMLSSMCFPPIVTSVVIAADNDTAGKREADKGAAAFAERGLRVRIIRPADGFKDFNSELMGGQA